MSPSNELFMNDKNWILLLGWVSVFSHTGGILESYFSFPVSNSGLTQHDWSIKITFEQFSLVLQFPSFNANFIRLMVNYQRLDTKYLKGLNQIPKRSGRWRHGVVVITTTQLQSTKSELRLCAGSNPAYGLLEIRNGEDL